MMHHRDERGAAGGCHLPAFFPCFDPFLRLPGGGHVSAEPHLDHICKTDLLKRLPDGCHADLFSELAFRSGCAHGDHTPALPDCMDDINHIDLGTDRAKGACVDTVAAVDAFILIDYAQAIFVIGDGACRTGSLAWPLTVYNGAERTGPGALSARFALVRVDLHLGIAGRDGVEAAGVQACFSEAETTAVRYHVILDRAVVTGCRNYGDDIFGRLVEIRVHPHREPHSSAYDLAFLIDTAPVGRFRARAHLIDDALALLVCEKIVPGHAADFPDDMMLQFDKAFIIGNHKQSSPWLNPVSGFCSLYHYVIAAPAPCPSTESLP